MDELRGTNGVVIIGAGHGGSQLAVALKAEGYPGPVTLIDPEAALPYHKPPLSKTFLKDPAAEPQMLRAESIYAGVRRIQGLAMAIDPQARTVAVDGGQVGYDELVLATGARNRRIPALDGAANVFGLRTLDDARVLRDALASARHVTVIGGGFIGLETAAALAGAGKTVTVLEALPRVLARVAAPETSETVSEALRDLGVDLRTDFANAGFVREGARVTRIVGDGGEIDTDLILVGIGADAAVELARDAGLAVDLGVVTDAALASSAPHVWAIGDVAQTPHWQTGRPERIESVQNATDQARLLAKTLASGERHAFRAVPWFWSDIGALKLQIAGLSHGADTRIVRRSGPALAVYCLRGGRLVAVETINSAADHMIARKLIEKGVTPTEAEIMAGPAALKPLAS